MTETHDREKAVKGLECCTQPSIECAADCPYAKAKNVWMTCSEMLMADALALLRRPPAVWQYYTNDEGKARWRCSECGKICRRDPRDKKFCSACGAEMRCEC